ncbi:MAG: PIN domain-containing protein [Rhizobiaceae bacterium]|nr:PIN domain-containing protein [Rhizobiaceae bacterium]
MRVALDSNVLLYAEGIDDQARRSLAIDIIARLPPQAIVLPVQAIGETFNVLVKRGARTRVEAHRICSKWIDTFQVVDTTSDLMTRATVFSSDHTFSVWDSVIVNAAAVANCRLLLSEDMQHGFTWNGVTIVNPFLEPMHPYLAEVLED